MHATTTTTAALLGGAGDQTCEVVLSYTSTDPYAITVTFGDPHNTSWTFARDILLNPALTHPVKSDVCVWTSVHGDVASYIISLTSPSGHATVALSRHQVDTFLAVTCQLVPVGDEHEHFDVDALIGNLLAIT